MFVTATAEATPLPPVEKLFAAIAPIDRSGKPLTLPKVGDGASYGVGSDTYPATVIAVHPYGKSVVVTVQDDEFRCRDDAGNEIPDTFTQNPNGAESHFRLDRFAFNFCGFENGVYVTERRNAHRWQQVYLNEGETHYVKSGGGSIGFGVRRYRMDPSF